MYFLNFVQKNFLVQAISLAGLFLGLIVYALFFNGYNNLNWFDPIIEFATFLVAVLVWFNGIRKDYIESLQKRLTVVFQFEGRDVLKCKDALLFNVADARAWSQQIGAQMTRCQRLQIDPFYKLEDLGIKSLNGSKQRVRSYFITLFLTKLPFPDNPASATNLSEEQKDFLRKLENGCLEWSPEMSEDGTFTVEPGWRPSNKQKIRL